MTTTSAPRAGRQDVQGQRPKGRAALAWAVLATAILQVVAPIVTINGPGRSPGGGSGPDLLITPVGWAFSIWSVIYALAIAQAVAVLVRGPESVSRRLQVDQVVLYAGAAAWILLAGLDSSSATAAALLVMLGAAVDGVCTAARDEMAPSWFVALTRLAIGLYAGWVTAASFLNVSTALVDLDVVDAGSLGWQLVVLALALATLVAVLVAARGNPAYAAAGAWAMVGIAVTGGSDGTGEVVVAALIALGVVVVVSAICLARGRRSAGVRAR